MSKRALCLLVALLAAALLAGGCAASPTYSEPQTEAAAESYDYIHSRDGGFYESYDGEMDYADDDAGGAGLPTVAQGRKIIRTAHFSIESRDFDGSVATIRSGVAAIGGYFESSSVEGGASGSARYSSMTIRVPDSRYDDFLAQLRGMETVTSETTQDSDVTEQYVDTEIRIDVLRQNLERLQDLQEKSEDVETIIRLQEEMSDILYNIESLTSDLRHLDARIDYATVTLYLRELLPDEITTGEQSLWDNVASAFIRSTNGVISLLRGAVVVASALLPVLILLAIGLGIFAVVFRIAAKRWPFQKKKQPPQQP